MIKCSHISAFPDDYLKLFGIPKDGQQDTIREFINAIERMTGPKGISFRSEEDRCKFKGDALEILSELFFTRFNSNPAMGLTEYTPVKLDEDFGVDARGINANGQKAVVQVKYRCNPVEVVTYADIARTFTSGIKEKWIDPSEERNVFVFTTASDVSRQCKQVLDSSLVVISRAIISRAIDNNRNFWTLCFADVQDYIRHHTGDSYAI
jgi:hypothetical protein